MKTRKQGWMTLDELIARLPPDRRSAVLAGDEKLAQAMDDARSEKAQNALTTT